MLSKFEDQIDADIKAYLMHDIASSINLYALRTGRTKSDAILEVIRELIHLAHYDKEGS